jgi:hypothetical protein
MSKSSLNGFSTGEHLTKISEAEILDLANKAKLDNNLENQHIATSLIHTVSAACKNITSTDEAAKEARTKLFSMWYSIGPPAVFFTLSPGDECSFRIKLFVNNKMELLPLTTFNQNECIADMILI